MALVREALPRNTTAACPPLTLAHATPPPVTCSVINLPEQAPDVTTVLDLEDANGAVVETVSFIGHATLVFSGRECQVGASYRFKLRNEKPWCVCWKSSVTLAKSDPFECTELAVVVAKGVVAGVAASPHAGEMEELRKQVRRLSATNEELLKGMQEAVEVGGGGGGGGGGARQRPTGGRARSRARK